MTSNTFKYIFFFILGTAVEDTILWLRFMNPFLRRELIGFMQSNLANDYFGLWALLGWIFVAVIGIIWLWRDRKEKKK